MGFDRRTFNVADLLKFFQSLDIPRKRLLTQVCTLAKRLNVMPATNAVSERSFSALKRVKSYLRSSTGQNRLNHLMVLHVHKELTDTIDMVELANRFVGENQTRKELVGKFSNDLPKLFPLATKATQTETLGSQVGNTDETRGAS